MSSIPFWTSLVNAYLLTWCAGFALTVEPSSFQVAVLLLTEITPKNVAVHNATEVARFVVRWVRIITYYQTSCVEILFLLHCIWMGSSVIYQTSCLAFTYPVSRWADCYNYIDGNSKDSRPERKKVGTYMPLFFNISCLLCVVLLKFSSYWSTGNHSIFEKCLHIYELDQLVWELEKGSVPDVHGDLTLDIV
jgi:hypothetical protein